jgi:hypothetical protein
MVTEGELDHPVTGEYSRVGVGIKADLQTAKK